MRHALTAFLLLLVGSQSCFGADLTDRREPQAVSICTIVKDAPKYDGQTILIKGLYQWQPHGAIMYGRGCLDVEVSLRNAKGFHADPSAVVTLKSLTSADEFAPVDVTVGGLFRVANSTQQCFGTFCAHYQIEAVELISASSSE
jgi:hypothetical protein